MSVCVCLSLTVVSVKCVSLCPRASAGVLKLVSYGPISAVGSFPRPAVEQVMGSGCSSGNIMVSLTQSQALTYQPASFVSKLWSEHYCKKAIKTAIKPH